MRRGTELLLPGLKRPSSRNQELISDATEGGEFTVTGRIQEDFAWPLDGDRGGDRALNKQLDQCLLASVNTLW